MCQIKSLDRRQDLRVGKIFLKIKEETTRQGESAVSRNFIECPMRHIVNGLGPISAKATTRENAETVSLASDHDDGTDVYDARDKETGGPLACQPSVSLAV